MDITETRLSFQAVGKALSPRGFGIHNFWPYRCNLRKAYLQGYEMLSNYLLLVDTYSSPLQWTYM